ncbi:MAG TPA: hypothetical protein DCZ10_14730 [Pelotomaculum sp.]|nr:hypothetical protein [Pelotomaculum sp.]
MIWFYGINKFYNKIPYPPIYVVVFNLFLGADVRETEGAGIKFIGSKLQRNFILTSWFNSDYTWRMMVIPLYHFGQEVFEGGAVCSVVLSVTTGTGELRLKIAGFQWDIVL